MGLHRGGVAHVARALFGETVDENSMEEVIDRVYEDTDFLFLFDPRYDGVDESELGKRLGMQSLRFETWFDPFDGGSPVHPYVAPRASDR